MEVSLLDYSYVATEERYRPDAVIIEEGSTGKWVYGILEGQVQVRKKTDKGDLLIATLKEGAVFGEMAFFQAGETVRSASVIADGPVLLGVLDNNKLQQDWASLSPQLRRLMLTLIERLQNTTVKAVEMLEQRELHVNT